NTEARHINVHHVVAPVSRFKRFQRAISKASFRHPGQLRGNKSGEIECCPMPRNDTIRNQEIKEILGFWNAVRWYGVDKLCATTKIQPGELAPLKAGLVRAR